MTRDTAELAVLVDAAARDVPGVTELYYAAALPTRLWTSTVHRTETFSAVSLPGGVPEALVSIGVARGRADEVARAVAVAVRAVLGDEDARVTVRVSRITVP